MNKSRIDKLIPKAVEILNEEENNKPVFKVKVKINDKKDDDENNEKEVIPKALRGQISSFGASVATGSLLAAVAAYSDAGNSDTPRDKLMDAIYKMVSTSGEYSGAISENCHNLFDVVKANSADLQKRTYVKQAVMECAVALKLAMNLFELDPDAKYKK